MYLLKPNIRVFLTDPWLVHPTFGQHSGRSLQGVFCVPVAGTIPWVRREEEVAMVVVQAGGVGKGNSQAGLSV